MKHITELLIWILAGIIIGWHFGRVHATTAYQREVLSHLPAIEAQMADLDKRRDKYFEAAQPYEASSASIALEALKNLDSNDVENTRSRLAAIVAIYYRGHSGNGDTNVLARIVKFSGSDTVLSNAINVTIQVV